MICMYFAKIIVMVWPLVHEPEAQEQQIIMQATKSSAQIDAMG